MRAQGRKSAREWEKLRLDEFISKDAFADRRFDRLTDYPITVVPDHGCEGCLPLADFSAANQRCKAAGCLV